MAAGDTSVLSGKSLTFASTDISAAVQSAMIRQVYETVEVPHSDGEAGGRTVNTGKYRWVLEATLRIDAFAASGINSLIEAALAATPTGSLAIKLKPTTADASATNPEWSGTVIVDEFLPFGDDGSPTAVQMVSVTYAGSGALAKTTT